MDKFYINAILKGIGSNLTCKSCKAKITLDKIDLIGQSNNMANFQITCPHCESAMKITAEISPIKNEKIKVQSKSLSKPLLENKWNLNIRDTIIKEDELKDISTKLKGLSSFKGLFGIFLVFVLFNFSGCEKSNELRNDILNGIEQAKEKSSEVYKDGKKLTASASILLNNAPLKIDKVKGDFENIVNDAKNAKSKADEKLKQAREALEKAEDAQNAFSEALDSFYKFIGTEEI